MKLKELQERMKALLKEVRDVAAKTEAENRDFSSDERELVTQKLAEIEGCKTQIKDLEGDDALRKSIEQLGGETSEPPEPKDPVEASKKSTKSIGEQFAEHVQGELKSVGGQLADNMDPRGLIAPMAAGGLKALVTGASETSAGAIVYPQDLGLRDAGQFNRPLVIRDLVTQGNTQSDTVTYVRQTSQTNAAAPTAEATASGGSSGTKPESSFALERISEPVKTIAHWIPATKRALSDAGQVRTMLDNFLRFGLDEELEDQMVLGDGIGENFTGISNVSGVQAQAWDTDLFVTTRKAKRKVKTVGRATATAYVLNPEDNERFDLATDANDRFFGNGPFGIGPDILWGISRIESEAIPVGTGYVGDWRYAVLWDREQASVVVGTINDQLIRNMVTLLAELRAAFGVIRPAAFVEIDLTA